MQSIQWKHLKFAIEECQRFMDHVDLYGHEFGEDVQDPDHIADFKRFAIDAIRALSKMIDPNNQRA